jgi:hypothetical protein
MSNKTSPAAVSARLRKAGFGIVATYYREGIRVRNNGARNNGKVCVVVDMDRNGEAARTADLLDAELATWEGFDVRREGINHFYIAKTAPLI